jgi:YD repeat-containing protein
MKKTLLSFLLITITAVSFGQVNCLLATDSITSGDEATAVDYYYYDAQDRLVRVESIDSNEVTYWSYDSLYYNLSTGYLDFTYGMYVGDPNPRSITAFTYNGSGQITRVDGSGNNGSPWSMSHDISYNGSDISGIILDTSSVTGSPEGMLGSFANMTWSGGNLTSVDLLVDFGAGIETIEISGTYDNKNNIERHYAITEASDLILRNCVNNVLQLTLINNEPSIGGTAGDAAMEHILTYDGNNEVATLTEVPAIFDDQNSVHDLKYFCTNDIEEVNDNKLTSFYPNPVSNELNIINLLGKSKIDILNITGKTIKSLNVNGTSVSINTSNYNAGVYIVRVNSDNEITSHKFIKQ